MYHSSPLRPVTWVARDTVVKPRATAEKPNRTWKQLVPRNAARAMNRQVQAPRVAVCKKGESARGVLLLLISASVRSTLTKASHHHASACFTHSPTPDPAHAAQPSHKCGKLGNLRLPQKPFVRSSRVRHSASRRRRAACLISLRRVITASSKGGKKSGRSVGEWKAGRCHDSSRVAQALERECGWPFALAPATTFA